VKMAVHTENGREKTFGWTNDQLAECKCNLCGSQSTANLLRRPDGLQVVKCKICGLAYINPRPRDELIPGLYGEDFFTSRSSIGVKDYFSEETKNSKIREAKTRLIILKEYGLVWFDKALEIGCGTGEFCHAIEEVCDSVTGIDISESAITEARSRYTTIPFLVGTIEDVDLQENYDAIFTFEVIEHLTNPDRFFAKATQLLTKNGVLCISTPSLECAESIGYDKWNGFFSSYEHLYFFSAATISRFADRHNMSVVSILYGQGKGLRASSSKGRLIIKKVLSALYMLDFLKKMKTRIQIVSCDYQTREPRHNLLMILRKK